MNFAISGVRGYQFNPIHNFQKFEDFEGPGGRGRSSTVPSGVALRMPARLCVPLKSFTSASDSKDRFRGRSERDHGSRLPSAMVVFLFGVPTDRELGTP